MCILKGEGEGLAPPDLRMFVDQREVEKGDVTPGCGHIETEGGGGGDDGGEIVSMCDSDACGGSTVRGSIN